MDRSHYLLVALVTCIPLPVSACAEPPCVATCEVVAHVQSGTVIVDPDEDFDVALGIEITNASSDATSCAGESAVTLEYEVTQTDDFEDLAEFEFEVTTELLAEESGEGTLTLTFPAAAEPGVRTFDVEIEGTNDEGDSCTRVCAVRVYFGEVMSIEDVSEYTCGVAGDPTKKVLLITNYTEEEREIIFEIKSTQTATVGPGGGGDHFPLAFCGEELDSGHPESNDEPIIEDSVILPGGVGETVEVCFLTSSFPACGPGSSCVYSLVGTDDETGNEVGVSTSHTVVSESWDGCPFVECTDLAVCSLPDSEIDDTASPVTDLLTVDEEVLVDALSVSVDVAHPRRGDLSVSVTSPDGTELILVDVDETDDEEDIVTEFDDDGSAFDREDLAEDGRMLPFGPGSFADFVGEVADGIWILTVEDDVSGSDGTLNEWCLEFTCPRQELRFVRGDANDSGNVSITDSLYILEFLFTGGPGLYCYEAGNANSNSGVTITDALYILQYLFAGGPAPEGPFPECETAVFGDDCAMPMGC